MWSKLLPSKKSFLIWSMVGLILFGVFVAMGVPANIAPLVALITLATLSLITDFITHQVRTAILAYRFSAQMKMKEIQYKRTVKRSNQAKADAEPIIAYYRMKQDLKNTDASPDKKKKRLKRFFHKHKH